MVETLANRHFRMTKRYITVMLIILGFQTDACAQKNEEIFTIYLVRHSEKNLASDSPSDPPLTLCGEQRSESLSSFLSAVALDAIYSTNYNRTESTALPTATSKGLEIKEYDSTLLLENKQDALVVGHSNTTGVLAGLLVGEELGEFDLDIYNRVYQVVVYGDSGRLHLLHTAFDCND
jgi:broad specificity phosphatase PhoE